jgi:hypothetical protein
VCEGVCECVCVCEGTAGGLYIHVSQVHKEEVTEKVMYV